MNHTTLIHAYRRLANYAGGSFRAWLVRVAWDERRQAQGRREALPTGVPVPPASGEADVLRSLVLLSRGNTVFMLGTYYRTPEELREFEQVVTSFKFISAASSTPVATQAVKPRGTLPPLPGAVPAGWHTYSDPTLGFSLAYPPPWEVCKQQLAIHSRVFCRPQPQSQGEVPPGLPPFWVTVESQELLASRPANNAIASAASFIDQDNLAGLLALPIGGSYSMKNPPPAEIQPDPAYWTFTRLPDTTVDGNKGVVVENQNPWGGKQGSKDRRVLVTRGTDTWQFGTYRETTEELREFEQVLAMFRFLEPPTETATSTAAPSPGSALPPSDVHISTDGQVIAFSGE